MIGTEELGVDLDMHIAFVIGALQAVAESIGLAGTEPPPSAA
jgi:predicted hydrolase (HD superfamily)